MPVYHKLHFLHFGWEKDWTTQSQRLPFIDGFGFSLCSTLALY